MTLETALMTAVGALVSVVVFLGGVIGYLFRELRSQYRERAKDSALFLTTLEMSRKKSSGIPSDHPRERRTPTDPLERPDPRSLAGFYSTHSKTSPRRG